MLVVTGHFDLPEGTRGLLGEQAELLSTPFRPAVLISRVRRLASSASAA